MKTNWEDLSIQLGVLQKDGSELYTGQSMQALEEILGDEWIESTIDYFIEGNKGNELAIKTIKRIQSNKAAEYAYKIFIENKNTNEQKASLALWAMSDIRMPICMIYLEECIGDKRYEPVALSIFRNLIFDSCLSYKEDNLNRLLNKFSYEYEEEILTLQHYIQNEFNSYNGHLSK